MSTADNVRVLRPDRPQQPERIARHRMRRATIAAHRRTLAERRASASIRSVFDVIAEATNPDHLDEHGNLAQWTGYAALFAAANVGRAQGYEALAALREYGITAPVDSFTDSRGFTHTRVNGARVVSLVVPFAFFARFQIETGRATFTDYLGTDELSSKRQRRTGQRGRPKNPAKGAAEKAAKGPEKSGQRSGIPDRKSGQRSGIPDNEAAHYNEGTYVREEPARGDARGDVPERPALDVLASDADADDRPDFDRIGQIRAAAGWARGSKRGNAANRPAASRPTKDARSSVSVDPGRQNDGPDDPPGATP